MRSMRHCMIAAGASMFLLIAGVTAHAATKTWSGNLPASGSVTIAAGDTVILDTSPSLTGLTINGTLLCGSGNYNLSADWIMVHGAFRCGTLTEPFAGKLTVTLKGSDCSADTMGMGAKVMGAMGGGAIDLHGENRRGWTRLAKTAGRGAAKITVRNGAGWRPGDRIVIVSSDYRPEHAEERTIAAISGNTLTLAAPLTYQHWCAQETFGPHVIEECAEVGLLSRNIVIRGDSQSVTTKFGGHVMAMSGSSLKLSGIEFLNMGQRGKVGRYPVHWHLAGDRAGDYLTNSSIVHGYNRFVTIHGTHNVRLAGNVGYDTFGHGYYLEDGIEHGNVIENNLGTLVRNATDGLPTPSDARAAVYWISNPDNTVRGNVAAGSEHTGFWLGFPEHPVGLSTTTSIWPRRTPLKEFANNVSHSNGGRGLNVDGGDNPDRTTAVTWYEPRQVPSNPSSPKVPPVFENFTAYKNRAEGVWMRGFSNPVLNSARLADNFVGAFFASLSGTPGYIRGSLVVGETSNKGNPESWEIKGLDGRELPQFWAPNQPLEGLQFYDGPMAMEDTLFANFISNSQRKSGALTNLAPNPFWISTQNFSHGLSFLNTNRVWIDRMSKGNNGDSFAIIRDADGSITGVPNQRIVPRNPVLATPSCTLKSNSNAYVCPHNYVGVQIFTYDGVDLSGTSLRRDDGALHVLNSAKDYPQNLHFALLEGRRHTLTLPFTVPKRITFNRVEGAGQAARLSLAYPKSNFTVTLWGMPVAKAGALSDLNAGGTKYYYDPQNQMLHLRLATPTGSWEEYEVKRP